MQEFGFFMSVALVGLVAYVVGGLLDARRRAARRAFSQRRPAVSERDFAEGVSAINPVAPDFSAAFRKTVGEALGVDAARLAAADRLTADLRVFGFDAMDLASALEQRFDVRVRVLDIVRAGTLRKLALLIYERREEISDCNPPLHRDPVPKVSPPEGGDGGGPMAPPLEGVQ
jgi:acyl carrier protein